MNSIHSDKRIFGFDLLKALAMFMVVFYHAEMLDFSFEPDIFYIPNFNKMIQLICAAGVPLFFMVNGALTTNNKITLNKVVNKVTRLFLIAIFWTLVLRCGINHFLIGGDQPDSIASFMNKYWFLYSLAYVYILNYLIQILPKCIGYMLVIAIFSVTFLNNFVWDIILFVNPDYSLPRWGHTGFFTFYGIVYSRIGAYLKNKQLSTPICIFFLILGLALNIFTTIVMTYHDGTLYDGVNSSFPTFGAMFLSIGFFSMLKDIKESYWPSQLIKTVGINSCGVYIFHVSFVFIIRNQMIASFHQSTYPIYVIILLALGVTILCAYISEWISRSPGKVLLKL